MSKVLFDRGSAQIGHLKRDFLIDNLLFRIHLIIVLSRWTGLAPWEFEFPQLFDLVSHNALIERF